MGWRGVGQPAHPCAGCPVSSREEKLGWREGEEIRQAQAGQEKG